MQFFDYLRLGWANIALHKKRALIVVVIAGGVVWCIDGGEFTDTRD